MAINSVSLALMIGLANPLFALVVSFNSRILLKQFGNLPIYKALSSMISMSS